MTCWPPAHTASARPSPSTSAACRPLAAPEAIAVVLSASASQRRYSARAVAAAPTAHIHVSSRRRSRGIMPACAVRGSHTSPCTHPCSSF